MARDRRSSRRVLDRVFDAENTRRRVSRAEPRRVRRTRVLHDDVYASRRVPRGKRPTITESHPSRGFPLQRRAVRRMSTRGRRERHLVQRHQSLGRAFRLHRSLRRESNLSQRFGGQARGSDRAAADGSPHDAAVGTGVQRRKRIESERHSHSRRFKVHRRHRGGVLSGVLEDARLRHVGVLHRRL